jgi:hypothetical protein
MRSAIEGSAQVVVEGWWGEFGSAILGFRCARDYICGVMGDALRREIVSKRGSLASMRG